MKPEAIEDIEEVAKTAAKIYGQADWAALPAHSQAIWRQTVCSIHANGGTTPMEQAAGKAVAIFQQNKIEAEVHAVSKKPKTKKGE